MRRKFIALIALVLPATAEAHGEEVLVTVFAQFVTVAAILAIISMVRALKRYSSVGFVGCFVGVAISWALTGQMPYRENRNLITMALVVLPVISTVLALVLARLLANKRGA